MHGNMRRTMGATYVSLTILIVTFPWSPLTLGVTTSDLCLHLLEWYLSNSGNHVLAAELSGGKTEQGAQDMRPVQ